MNCNPLMLLRPTSHPYHGQIGEMYEQPIEESASELPHLLRGSDTASMGFFTPSRRCCLA
jgi:hypothetical protein